MQFNSETNNQDIISDITFWTGVDTTIYTLNDRTRNVNNRYSMIWQVIFEAYGGWQFMDDNIADASSGVPYADQTITSGTQRYTLPSAALTVIGVEVKYQNGTFRKLIPMTREEFLNAGGDARFAIAGVPTYYLLDGDIIELLPIPNYTQASSLRVFFDQDISLFVPGDTSKVPGFASPFHRALSIGAALDFALANPTSLANKVSVLTNEWEKFVGSPSKKTTGSIQAFYAKRFKDRFPNRVGSGSDLIEEFR